MKLREYNDWMFLNNLIYKIYTMPDEKEMRTVFLDRLGMIVDFDAADFSLSDDNGFNKLISCVGLNSDSSEVEQLDKLDYSRGILYSGQCMVYRETDIISDDTRVNTDYYRRIYLKNHWHYAAQMIFARKKRFLGVVTLYRSIGKENFNHDDIMILDLLKDHMSFRLYCEYEKRTHKAAIDISAFCEKYALTNREKLYYLI